MKTGQWLKTRSPYEIPIAELDLPVRVYNSCLRKDITTVRGALSMIRQSNSSAMHSLIEAVLEKRGYL